MTTTQLAKQYAALTPAERLPLVMAASARGDDVEYRRLMDSAPRVSFTAPHHFPLGMAFREVAEQHHMELLALAGWYLYSFAAADGDDAEPSPSLLDCALLFGYLFKINAAGWRAFCADLAIDPDTLPNLLPGRELLDQAARLAESAAFTPDGALAHVRRRFDPKQERIPTADDVAAGLRDVFKARADQWG